MRAAGTACLLACLVSPAVADDTGGLFRFAPWLDPNDTRLARNLRLTVGGWLNAGGTYNAEQPEDHFNGPVSFGDRSGEVQLNQFYLYAERKALAGDAWDWGARLDFAFGSDAVFTRSLGDPADHWDSHLLHRRIYGIAFPQAYVEVAAPLGNGLRAKFGEFYTLIGNESVMAPDNFFYSHSYAMQYGEPFSHTGVLADYAVREDVEIHAGAVTGSPFAGWDGGFEHYLENWAFLGGIHWTPPNRSTRLALSGTHGALSGEGERQANLYSMVLRHDFTAKLHYTVQHDHGWLAVRASHRPSEWYGLVQYLSYDLSDRLSAGVRLEWFRDDDGVRVAASAREPARALPASSYYAATAGLVWKPRPWVSVRPNLRYDISDGARAFDAGNSDRQLLLSADVLLAF